MDASIVVGVSVALLAIAIAFAEPLHDPFASVIRRLTLFRALLLLCALGVVVPAVELAWPRRRRFDRPEISARWASAVLGLVVGAAAGLWVVLGTTATLPRILGDELLYMDLGKSLGRGDGLLLRGVETYGYSFGYPAFLAPFYALTDSAVTAYQTIQTAQAYVMASAAIPVYLLARCVLRRPRALLAAALAVMTPHLLMSTLVMTEALVFPATMWFCLAAVRALDSPTLGRQAVAVAALGVATAVRLQAILLAAALVTAVVLRPSVRGRVAELRRWAPTWGLILGVAVVGAVGAAATGAPLLGKYSTLLVWPDVAGTAIWTARTLGALSLAVGVVAAVGLVPGSHLLLRGTPGEASVAAVCVSVIFWTVAVVGHFSATPWADEHVHERNVFTLLPLVLVVALAWAERGLPRPALPTVAGGLAVIACVAMLRQRDLLSTFDVDAPTLHVWRIVDSPAWPASRLVVLAALVGTGVALTSRRPWIIPLVAALAMVVAIPVPRAVVGRSATEALAWVDEAAGRDARALVLTANLPDCERRSLEETALWTELFNLSAVRAAHILSENRAANWDSQRMVVGRDGVVRENGEPVHDPWVVLDSRLEVDGTEVARVPPNVLGDHPEARVGMTLWKVAEPLRILNADLLGSSTPSPACPSAP